MNRHPHGRRRQLRRYLLRRWRQHNSIGEALRALRLNRLRTGLTMFGMIIGVAAVVLMLAVGQGAPTTVNQKSVVCPQLFTNLYRLEGKRSKENSEIVVRLRYATRPLPRRDGKRQSGNVGTLTNM